MEIVQGTPLLSGQTAIGTDLTGIPRPRGVFAERCSETAFKCEARLRSLPRYSCGDAAANCEASLRLAFTTYDTYSIPSCDHVDTGCPVSVQHSPDDSDPFASFIRFNISDDSQIPPNFVSGNFPKRPFDRVFYPADSDRENSPLNFSRTIGR
jgi:hypothetical protein